MYFQNCTICFLSILLTAIIGVGFGASYHVFVDTILIVEVCFYNGKIPVRTTQFEVELYTINLRR